jgi:type IV pilus assembly protein PilW
MNMLSILTNDRRLRQRVAGMTLVEVLVALAIGSFLIIGAVQVYNQSRQAYVINDAIARVQETAQFAMDTIEADLRMASNYGLNSRGDSIEGRALPGIDNPQGFTDPRDLGSNQICGARWVWDLERPIQGDDDAYGLACPPDDTAQANSDTITVRRASSDPVALDASRFQIQANVLQGIVIDDGTIPTALGFTATNSQTHNLIVNTYYVDTNSQLIPGVPTLRRKTLGVDSGAPAVLDIEVAPGVENLQVQFGVDMDDNGTVDRYVNPDSVIITPGAAGFEPEARITTARIWLVVRSISPEIGIVDTTDYEPGNVDLGVPNDEFRRIMVSKTILLRNIRT